MLVAADGTTRRVTCSAISFYGQVSLGQWREFYKLWEKLDQTIRAKNLAPSQLSAPTVGTLNSFMLTTDYETIEAFQANQTSFYADAESMTIWRTWPSISRVRPRTSSGRRRPRSLDTEEPQRRRHTMKAEAPKGSPAKGQPTTGETTKCCDAFSANSGLDPMPFSDGAALDAVTLDLPAGNYVVNAKVLVGDRSSAGGGDFLCTLRHGQTGNVWIDTSGARLFGGAPANAGSTVTLPFTATVALTSQDTIRLNCATSSSDAFAQFAQLNAIEVGTITT